MAYIVLKDLEKYDGEQYVLKKTNLSIQKGEFVTLLGASGCGKSTLLRCIAGLETVTAGKVYLEDRDITNTKPRERNVGMVFQQYSLFPNMTVFNNIAYGLKIKKMAAKEIEKAVLEALELVDLRGSEKKYPSQLSGGERQRVALARSIVTKPKVLLLDEPLSAIDAKLRKALQTRIKEIHKELHMTSIFVTHDQDEAMTMSDTIHLMRDGVIVQSGNPIEIYAKPNSIFAASFMGNYNLLDSFGIRPETIAISKEPFGESQDVIYEGLVQHVLPQGNILRYTVKTAEHTFKVDTLFIDPEILEIGSKVYLKIKKEHFILLGE